MIGTSPRRLGGLVVALLLVLPASSAFGAGASVTGDDGTPIALGGPVTIRNMKPDVTFQFAPDEQRYVAEVLGPGGQPAATPTPCTRASAASPVRVAYQGNGNYTVVLRVARNADDVGCAEATEQRLGFAINAFTAVTPPASVRLLTRRPGELALVDYGVPVNLNPGADSHEVRYAAGATLAPDGSLAGASEQGVVDTATRRATLRFPRPGRYTVVARAKVLTGGGEAFTAWSTPVVATVVAPFDLSANRFTDSRGPTYRIAGRVRERTVTGRMTVSMARGSRGGRFKRLTVVRLGPRGRFAYRFRLRRRGTYRVRYAYKGGATVAAGTVTQAIRITQRFRETA